MKDINVLEGDIAENNEYSSEPTQFPYRKAISSLIYLMIGTPPDLGFEVGTSAQFCEAPSATHWNTVRGVFRYVNGTRHIKICFTGFDQLDVCGYTDSDWAGDTRDRKSTNGYHS